PLCHGHWVDALGGLPEYCGSLPPLCRSTGMRVGAHWYYTGKLNDPAYVPTDELERLGYDIIIFASDVQRATIFGMCRLLQESRAKRTGEWFTATVGFQEREGIINSDYYFQPQERYLRLEE